MSTKVLIILLSGVILLLGLMGGGFFLLWQKMSMTMIQVQQQNMPAAEVQAIEQAQAEAAQAEKDAKVGPLYKMDTLIVNLADQGGKRYLRLTMEWELSGVEAIQEIDKRMAQLRDAILMILPAKQYADISSAQGKIDLRDELIARVNSILRRGSVTNIYFTEFVVQ
jgi:flagellar protein FliL